MNKFSGKKSLSLTIDIEDWYHIPSVCGSPFSVYQDTNDFFNKWKDKYDYLTEPTKRTLNILDEFNLSATFFIVADVIMHYPELVELIVEKGHEIGCHGLNHSCKIHPKTKEPLMSIKSYEERTLKAKKILENFCKEKILGYRAPNALIGGWMLNSLEKIGFKYDSSICVNSFYNKTDSSLMGVSSCPFNPKFGGLELGEKGNFIEFPWAFYDVVGIRIPTSGGPCLRFLGTDLIIRGLKQSLKRGHTTFYFHPIDLSVQKFPKIGKGRPFYWVIKGEIIEKRVRYILKYFNNKSWICLRDFAGELI